MSYQMTGKIKKILDTQTFASGFSKREFVVTVDGKYPQDIVVECVKEKITMLDGFRPNDTVTVHFDIRGREYNDRYFVNLAAWKIERGGGNGKDGGDKDYEPEDTTDYGVETGDPF